MQELREELATSDLLETAWRSVLEADGQRATPDPGVRRFAGSLDENLERLAQQIDSKTYRPGTYKRLSIRTTKRRRVLWIPDVEQRVVERGLTLVFDRRVDGLLSPRSCAYRIGMGVNDALLQVAESRDVGATHVLLADICHCFDQVSCKGALSHLQLLADDDSLGWLFSALVERIQDLPGMADKGIPQGAPLSPLLANIALDPVDQELTDSGLDFVRYSDDLAIACASASAAKESATALNTALSRQEFTAGLSRCETATFEAGFMWLGEELNRQTPSSHPDRPRGQRTTVYVGGTNRYLRLKHGRLCVSRNDQEETSVPIERVDRLVVLGPVGISAGVRQWTLGAGVSTDFLSQKGNYLGTAHSRISNHVSRRMAQYDAARSPRAQQIAVQMIRGKLLNCRALLLRYGTGPAVGRPTSQLRALARQSRSTTTREQLMGTEAAAAKIYWESFGALMPKEAKFGSRTRRPPRDVVNAALSLGYAILEGECCGAIIGAGLDPACPVLHSVNDNRDSLSLDLMEEFRSVIVDTVVLDCFRRGILKSADGRSQDNGGVFLSDAGRKAFLGRYEQRLLTLTSNTATRKRLTWRAMIHAQARHLACCFLDDTRTYQPARWR